MANLKAVKFKALTITEYMYYKKLAIHVINKKVLELNVNIEDYVRTDKYFRNEKEIIEDEMCKFIFDEITLESFDCKIVMLGRF